MNPLLLPRPMTAEQVRDLVERTRRAEQPKRAEKWARPRLANGRFAPLNRRSA